MIFKVIFGPMFSGKTTELFRRLKRYKFANYRCVIIRYEKDNRYSNDRVATHDRQSLPAVLAAELKKVNINYDAINVIGIDEGQFFPDIVEYCEEMANRGKIVVVAALDGTYQRLGFGNILSLVPLAESVVKLTAVCMSCFREASYTKRIGLEKEVEVIGGAEKYMAVCRECHRLKNPVKQSPFKDLPVSNGFDVTKQCRNLFLDNNVH
ncbi:thymidine kinase, cytosolic-like isoform X2 [Lycorma delicatula]|uniref:thymidine kinase, cytosolic-like isoform X2 n=1 Tax=Lycorma delicatula TaxID=130591 RepID=UPI003F519DBC